MKVRKPKIKAFEPINREKSQILYKSYNVSLGETMRNSTEAST